MKQLEKEIFGIPVIKKELNQKKGMPLFIKDLYNISKYQILDIDFLLVEPKEETIDLSIYDKHMNIITKQYKLPCVIYLEYITPYQRNKLINTGTPFIYQQKQIYMPFLGMFLEEHFKQITKQNDYLTYNAQFVFLFLYYRQENTPIRFIDITKYLKISKANCTRALSELEQFNIVNIETKGREKYVLLKENKKQSLKNTMHLMRSPLQKTIYVSNVEYYFIKSNILALSKKTNLAQHNKDYYYAVDRMKYLSTKNSIKEVDPLNEQAKCLEIWMYDPGILSDKGVIDDISLLLLLKDNKDYRINDALDEIKVRHNLND